ncbi:RDD family protein [Tenuibacillus multivorans]|uniref:Uncharacterized membrane protein YckC, RDD family n=1 Tax=Tenuibacillus multivorans TaxID=237069 RepID=A0A1H0B0U8_9BACI|nr:RDD family protein [Tenuibacillus multivorans]GEL77578.1 hypothetical protein TMU01_18130 [Tenuibacillus multivorans]SDN39258.1 Uncharacterized membrane protein YckC, RDD family [Tenuibacillus multivorans]
MYEESDYIFDIDEEDPGGFWRRLLALIIDAIIVGLPVSAVVLLFMGEGAPAEAAIDLIMFLYGVIVPVVWSGYVVGKYIMGVRIVKENGDKLGIGTMLMRNLVAGIAYVITFGILLIVSILMVAIRDDKKAVHDFVAGTRVIRSNR